MPMIHPMRSVIVGDTRVATQLDRYDTQVKKFLMENKNKPEALTAHLAEEKTRLGDQVQQILKCA